MELYLFIYLFKENRGGCSLPQEIPPISTLPNRKRFLKLIDYDWSVNAHISIYNDVCSTEAGPEVDQLGTQLADWILDRNIILYNQSINLILRGGDCPKDRNIILYNQSILYWGGRGLDSDRNIILNQSINIILRGDWIIDRNIILNQSINLILKGGTGL